MTSSRQQSTARSAAGRGRRNWTRAAVEAAVLLIVTGAAPLVLGVHTHDLGARWLIAAGVVLLAATALGTWWKQRRRRSSDLHLANALPEPSEFDEVADPRRTLWRLRASVADTPGRLARLAAGLASLGGNIRTVQVHPVPDGAVDDVLVHVPAHITAGELVRAVTSSGGSQVTAAPADVRELDDVPTRTLRLAASLVRDDAGLVSVLRGVLGDVAVHWRESDTAGSSGEALCLAAPGGGVLLLHRPGAPFTPAETARARTMAALAADCRERLIRQERTVGITGRGQLRMRVADRQDLPVIAALRERCSGPEPLFDQDGGLRLLTPALGRALVLFADDGSAVALGSLMFDGNGADMGILVRDDWHRSDVGSALARALVAEAEGLGLARVTADTRIDDTVAARTLRDAGLKLSGVPEPGEWCWTRDLTRRSPARAA